MIRRRRFTRVAAAAILSALPALAETITWTNPAGGSWTDAANWSLNRLPGPDDEVLIPDLPAAATVTLSSGTHIVRSVSGSFTLADSAFLTADTVSRINLTGGTVSAQSVHRVILAGGTLRNAAVRSAAFGDLPFNSTLIGVTLESSLIPNYLNHSLTIAGGLTLKNDAFVGISTGDITFVGTQSVTGSGSIRFGVFDFFSGATVAADGASAATLTIGPGITIGGQGNFTPDPQSQIVVAGRIITADFGAPGTYGYPVLNLTRFSLAPIGTLDSTSRLDASEFTWTDAGSIGGQLAGTVYARVNATTRLHMTGTGVLTVPAEHFAIADDSHAGVDVDRGGIVIDYTPGQPSPFPTIHALVVRGYNNGSWDGPGLSSLPARDDPARAHGVGIAEARDVNFSSILWDGPARPTDPSAVIVRYTLYGDSDLDGRVTHRTHFLPRRLQPLPRRPPRHPLRLDRRRLQLRRRHRPRTRLPPLRPRLYVFRIRLPPSHPRPTRRRTTHLCRLVPKPPSPVAA